MTDVKSLSSFIIDPQYTGPYIHLYAEHLKNPCCLFGATGIHLFYLFALYRFLISSSVMPVHCLMNSTEAPFCFIKRAVLSTPLSSPIAIPSLLAVVTTFSLSRYILGQPRIQPVPSYSYWRYEPTLPSEQTRLSDL